ncbi:hypothetical protein DSUL_30094 [Desulfovibrionales bacterium]
MYLVLAFMILLNLFFAHGLAEAGKSRWHYDNKKLFLYQQATRLSMGTVKGHPSKAVAGKQDKVRSMLVLDLSGGHVLQEKAPDLQIPPASVTKIMSLFLVYEALESGKVRYMDKVRVSAKAATTGGSTMGLKVGETVSLSKLMAGMAIASGNDACVAVAEHFGGEVAFVAAMNRKAQALGMTRSVFKNPHGLPELGQVVTARDLAKLATVYLKRFPQSLSQLHSRRTIVHNGHARHNANLLLGTVGGVDGLKTGYVAASGFNMVATAKRGSIRLLAVVLGGHTWRIRNIETARAIEKHFAQLGQISQTLVNQRTKQIQASSTSVLAPSQNVQGNQL